MITPQATPGDSYAISNVLKFFGCLEKNGIRKVGGGKECRIRVLAAVRAHSRRGPPVEHKTSFLTEPVALVRGCVTVVVPRCHTTESLAHKFIDSHALLKLLSTLAYIQIGP
jgi:hypothetical protein